MCTQTGYSNVIGRYQLQCSSINNMELASSILDEYVCAEVIDIRISCTQPIKFPFNLNY